MDQLPPPGPELVRKVRAAFIVNGTTLGRWCRQHKINDQNARLTLLGGWNGPKGLAMRDRIIKAAGLASGDAGTAAAAPAVERKARAKAAA